ncbi:MAG: hypothetical protein U1D41_00440 [Nitrosomonas sp.]|uniref:hypothetical protein n=1 Tax=Nitrosomonas sp. TaxID=42353 RepID=UPI0027347738|nr:hypothetical protein [Nitrosomonas sp.]MDP3662888.1 hypothetical protein [Nitrosomonas sp.]MDZ4104635.1 hypothetical protein [Nitrosomonas sp.]
MKDKLYLVIIGLILALPIAVYSYQFGFDEWAEMGSAIGGLYTPILSILTLIVLVKQFQLQKSMHKYEQRVMSRDISFSLVEKYAAKIESMFTQEVVDDLVRLAELDRGDPEADKLKSKHLDIFTLWATVHASLRNYEKHEPNMIVDLASTAVLHLTFNMCATLEQAFVVHMCDSKEKRFKYWFMENA